MPDFRILRRMRSKGALRCIPEMITSAPTSRHSSATRSISFSAFTNSSKYSSKPSKFSVALVAIFLSWFPQLSFQLDVFASVLDIIHRYDLIILTIQHQDACLIHIIPIADQYRHGLKRIDRLSCPYLRSMYVYALCPNYSKRC